MKQQEIRLRWAPGVVHWTDVIRFSDEWQPFSPENLITLKIVVDAANAIYGEGTHWTETRDVDTKVSV